MPTSTHDRVESVKLLTLRDFQMTVWSAIDEADTPLRAGPWLTTAVEIETRAYMWSLARIILIGQQIGRGGQ